MQCMHNAFSTGTDATTYFSEHAAAGPMSRPAAVVSRSGDQRKKADQAVTLSVFSTPVKPSAGE